MRFQKCYSMQDGMAVEAEIFRMSHNCKITTSIVGWQEIPE